MNIFRYCLLCLVLLFACGESENSNHKYVFLTFDNYEGFSLGGLEGADEICSFDALQAGLKGDYVAWLSITGINAKDRISSISPSGSEYEYYTVDNKYIGFYSDIIQSTLHNPINVDANGVLEEQFSYVWTDTNYNGEFFNNGYSGDCSGWNGFEENSFAVIGKSNAKNIEWTNLQANPNIGPAECINFYKLYCFER